MGQRSLTGTRINHSERKLNEQAQTDAWVLGAGQLRALLQVIDEMTND